MLCVPLRMVQALTHSDGSAVLQITDSTYDAKAPELLNKIAEKYQLSNLTAIARGTASAQALATMGAGSAYAVGEHSLIVGASGGMAVNGVDQPIADVAKKLGDFGAGGDTLPRFGVGSQASAVIGMNLGSLRLVRYLGPFELSRLTIMAHFLQVSTDSITSGLNLSATVAGLHAQYRLASERGSAALRYGEVLLVTGFDYSRLLARYDSTTGTKSLTPIAVGGGTLADPQLVWNPAGIMQLSSGSGTIPIELVTSIRPLWLLSLYLGAAVDLNVGKATAEIQLSGDLTGTSGGAPVTVGSGSIATSLSESPPWASGRAFLGVQLNLLPGKKTNFASVFTQASFTTSSGVGVQAGLRCAW